jgi:predicted ATPase
MIISDVYVRFYRAFNFDYLRKEHEGFKPDAWDGFEGGSYPYVRVPLDERISCIVGANESGKSQLLNAIEHALGQRPTDPADFCRYSQFFTVESGLRHPHFGVKLTSFTTEEATTVGTAIGHESNFTTLRVFRETPGRVMIYCDGAADPISVDASVVDPLLPQSFRIDPARELPEDVPIDYLVKRAKGEDFDYLDRSLRLEALGPLVKKFTELSAAAVDPAKLGALVQPAFAENEAEFSAREDAARRSELDLAFDLLVSVAGIATDDIARLGEEMIGRRQGYVTGLIGSINQQLAKALNLPRWWTQDDKFELRVAARDYDLVFTIKDRTASEYSFAERSDGLKYFLSYLVQYRAAVNGSAAGQVLLMDEPDAFLSNQAQQDLLRLFQDFAGDGVAGREPRQVVFVTHSPFLIDRNRSDRVRVLDKGIDDEGTRVVRDAGRHHFEPLRSAIGGYIGESTLLSNSNIVLEGVSDQVYLAGISGLLTERGAPAASRLDLNATTLVAAGSSEHVPYHVYLARGRDAQQPAVVVMLDGDKPGTDAAGELRADGPLGRTIDGRFVLQLNDDSLSELAPSATPTIKTIEDLVHADVLAHACTLYADEIGLADHEPISGDDIREVKGAADSVKALAKALDATGSKLRVDKVALARNVVASVRALDKDSEGVLTTLGNFGVLFSRLKDLQLDAMAERTRDQLGVRVDRWVNAFLTDFEDGAAKSDLKSLLDRIERILDGSPEADAIRSRTQAIRSGSSLGEGLSEPVEDFSEVVRRLGGLKYAAVVASHNDA